MRGFRLPLLSLTAVLMLSACGKEAGDLPAPPVAGPAPTPTPTPPPTPTPTPPPTPTPTTVSSLGADGWASTQGGTTGGEGATAAKTYIVTNRNELLQALYGGTATIADDGSVTGTLDASPKIIRVSGTVSLNVDRQLREQTGDDYVRASCASATYGYSTETALYAAYYAAFRPSVWGSTRAVSGAPESARACAAVQQRRVVQIAIPSNTSILGLGGSARIINGNLNIGPSSAAPVENIVIRNIAFEDSFDFFPQWDPTDSTGRWNSAYDIISVQYARKVWIDHNSFSDGARTDDRFPSVWTETVGGVDFSGADFKVQHHDGLADVTRNGDLVTMSNNLFFNHDKGFLIGGTDTANPAAENPTALRVTFHDNIFRNLRQRLPRVRYGQVHVYNNLYEGVLAGSAYNFLVALTVGQSGKIYAENNILQIPDAGATNLAGTSISAARTAACRTIGYSEDQCASTFYASGTVLNGVEIDLQASVLSRFPAVTATRWYPALFYAYQARPTEGLAQTILANAGAGKL
ncbi:pectate lyase family protein [Sphingomonas montana]|uniref:pectate lyase family protein n=1 Tax=Sphingomonas montana TaxID=1843236 RepID=UPI001F0B460D|nr:pectate lyase [Sphingomonas montana]